MHKIFPNAKITLSATYLWLTERGRIGRGPGNLLKDIHFLIAALPFFFEEGPIF